MALEEKYDDEVAFIIVDVDHPQSEKLIEAFNVSSIPVFFYIDPKGNIVGNDIGSKSFKHMEERILKDLLGKKK
ncbi:hypothetical protein CACET_c29160 [Clostridium aceticum]|uniref:Uncharacterized protein n=1 Tax=Clostridium aceticum TaxID=84022 RepID=A0A0D8I9L5_9CLOT|nr:hypothetical protein CACET_c29160 [Clostridium aceticum]KJF26948.1 hypothetical protein TZ02_10460 [Clostridium aceticum]